MILVIARFGQIGAGTFDRYGIACPCGRRVVGVHEAESYNVGRALNTHRKVGGVDTGNEEEHRLFGEGQGKFHLPCADVAGGVELAVARLAQRRVVTFLDQGAFMSMTLHSAPIHLGQTEVKKLRGSSR